MSALTLSLLAAYVAPAHALLPIGDDVQVDGYAQIGTTTTSATVSTGAGSGSTPPPPSTNNGNGTTTLYNISAFGASNVSSTSTTGGVLAEPTGNITGTGGSTTTSSSTWDVASYIIVQSSNVTQVVTSGTSMINMMNSTATVAGEGGNLVMSGNGTFGGDLHVAGTIYGNGTDGALVLHGGTASTSITIDNNGITVADSGNGTTFTVGNSGDTWAAGSSTADGGFYTGTASLTAVNTWDAKLTTEDDVFISADNNNGGVGAIYLQKYNTTLASFDNAANGGAEFYVNLDMNGNNINGVGTITATTGNITTINSTTINNAGNITNQGNLVNNGNVTVNGTTTLNGATTVNNSLTVDTNGGSGNVTGTGRVVVQTNSAVFGVQNAGGNLNGIEANTTGTIVRGGTNSSTLTLQQNSAVLNSGASSSLSLTTDDADLYGYTTAEIRNAYGSQVYVYGDNAYMNADSYAQVYGGYETWVGNDYGSNTWTNGYSAGITSQADTYVTGGNSVQLNGGGSSMVLNSDGATFSGEGGSPIRVHGVAAGKAKTDAVNVGQLESAKDSLSGGIASIAAIANIPHVDPKKTFAVGIGYGNYDGQSGYAVGGSYRFMEDGILKASVAGSDDGETAWGVGAGFSW